MTWAGIVYTCAQVFFCGVALYAERRVITYRLHGIAGLAGRVEPAMPWADLAEADVGCSIPLASAQVPRDSAQNVRSV